MRGRNERHTQRVNISCLDFEKNGFSLLSCKIVGSGDVRFRLNFNRNGGENGKVFGENGKVFGDPFLCMFSFQGVQVAIMEQFARSGVRILVSFG